MVKDVIMNFTCSSVGYASFTYKQNQVIYTKYVNFNPFVVASGAD